METIHTPPLPDDSDDDNKEKPTQFGNQSAEDLAGYLKKIRADRNQRFGSNTPPQEHPADDEWAVPPTSPDNS